MDSSQFDDFIRSLAGSRRSLLGGTLAISASLIGLPTIDARKKRKRKRNRNVPRTPQATPNEFGCLNVDDPCTSADECCSGICQGPKGARTCRAHDTGGCEPGIEPEVCGEENESICTTNSGDEGYCGTTTGNAGYCAGPGDCYPCRTDVECQRANNGFFGPRAACLKCTLCSGTGGTACFMAEFP